MRNAILALVLAASPASAVESLNGAGATFPFPIYSKWFDEYHKAKPDLQINYQSIGSGGGIRQITERTVDFGASDAPLTDRQLAKVDGKLLHIPTVMGAVVPVYNVQGVGKINFTGEVLADIFLAKIVRWNDPKIAAENPGVKLPDMPITVVRRSDGSGTTYCWTDYLSTMSSEWSKKVGRAPAVNWPIGLGARGNEGVAGLVIQTPNSIGYVEVAYAKQNGMTYGKVKNKAGKYADADVANIAAAGAAVKVPKDYRVSIVNAAGENAYPISTYTWLLIYEKNTGGRGEKLRDFLAWMLEDGQKMASELGFAPLAAETKARVLETIKSIK